MDDTTQSLLWSLLILALGGATMFMWNSTLPAPLLWAGYTGVIVGVALLVHWWARVAR